MIVFFQGSIVVASCWCSSLGDIRITTEGKRRRRESKKLGQFNFDVTFWAMILTELVGGEGQMMWLVMSMR